MITITSLKAYQSPVLEDLGTATDLTRNGCTIPGPDTRGGSNDSTGGGMAPPCNFD